MKELFAKSFSKKFKTTKKYGEQVYDFFVSEIARRIKSGEKVLLKGIGSFQITKKNRKFFNPATGKTFSMKNYKRVKFVASKMLRK